jgi:hypothetical protein
MSDKEKKEKATVNENEVYTIPYEDIDGNPTGFEFDVKTLTANDFEKINNMSRTGQTFNIRTGQQTNEGKFDIPVFYRELIKTAIVGWKGLTNEILPDIMIHEKIKFKGPSRKSEIPFAKEVLEEIAENPSFDFIQYLNTVFTKVIPKARKEKLLSELKN